VAVQAGINQFNHGHLRLGNSVLGAGERGGSKARSFPLRGGDRICVCSSWDGKNQWQRWSYLSTVTRGHTASRRSSARIKPPRTDRG
jgi:hypothetical protein